MIDQNCPLNATTAKIFVNALGEVWKNNQIVDLSIDLRELAEANNLDWNVVCHYKHKDPSKQARQWRKLIEAKQEANLSDLEPHEKDFVKKVYGLQTRYETGRFRVYAEIRQNNEQAIVLVTEFQAFLENAEFWQNLDETAKNLKAHVWFMREEPHNDKFMKFGDTEWQYGENHGKMERQVELSWRIEDLNTRQITALRNKIKAATEQLQEQGVCVI